VPVRFLTSVDLHAKLVIADGVALVGSQNLSPTSLSDNREVGVLVTESGPVATLQAQLDADWAAATPF
jgi:phosphatidylserine/phosphatidylglycerophosphate/cardiolipin synthase-like enzyme